MIQSLYFFQSNSRNLLYNKNFQSDEKMEMFSSFFGALQTFVSELTTSTTESLSTIELGEYLVLISRVPEVSSDLVIIIDKEDNKEAQKLIPKIVKIVMNYQDLFVNWDKDLEMLEKFDLKIVELILSNKKLISESSMTIDQSSILKSIWELKGTLSDQIRETLLKKKEKLTAIYLTEENYLKKYETAKRLIKISEKLRDDEKFIEYEIEAKSLRDEIKDRRLRLQYYLDMVKESLEFSRYAETYSYLYSFCLKLKNFTDPQVIEKYTALAKVVLNREKITTEEFREAV
ncbi:MAG: hypothetical protein ACXAAI_14290, partial [Promethearchaeota archaeon]